MARQGRRRGPVRLGAWVLAAMAFVGLAACDSLGRERSLGETVWREQCARCHGIDGGGTVLKYAQYRGSNLLDNHWEYGGEPFEMETVILQGIFPTMPAFEELSDDEIAAVIEYIGTLRGGT